MKRRHGFTLVELLVSMALIIFIMAILSQAFVAALGTFRNLKGQGDLAEKLRSTTQILQHDLGANHFDGSRRLSDPTFWNNGPPSQGFFQIYQGPPANPAGTWLGTSPVLPATLQVYQGTPILGSTPEGTDLPNVIGSFRSVNHCLAFTVKLKGNDMGDFMSASGLGSGNVWNPLPLPTGSPNVPQLPGNPTAPFTNGLGIGAIQMFGPPESRYQAVSGALVPNVTGYNYQWAAVAWFLQPQMNPTTGLQDQTVADANAASQPVPLYTLYRRQAMLVPDNTLVALSTTPLGGVPILSPATGQPNIAYFQEMSCLPDPKTPMLYFNNPGDITMPANRFWGGLGPFPLPPSATPLVPPDMPPYLPIPASIPVPVSTPTPGLLRGSDIQLNDVVSFDVRVLPLLPVGKVSLTPNDPFVTLTQAGTIFTDGTFTYTAPPGFLPLPTQGAIFDTWSSYSNGLNDYSQWNNMLTPTPGVTIPFWNSTTPLIYSVGSLPGQNVTVLGSGPIIKAIQVTIRIWDFKTSQTRQVTIVQAM